jgi:hypothetical protein
MELSQSDLEKISSWLKEKCGIPRCFMCGNARWSINNVTTLQIGFNVHTTRFHYGQGLPLFSVTCTTCGNTVFLNPAVLGFKPEPPQVESVEPSRQ